MRLRKVKNAKEKIEQYPSLVILEPSTYKGNWKGLFENENPIHIEIGMGKGKFLLEKAIKEPSINFVGIEKFDSVLIRAVEKIAPFHLVNVLLLNLDAIVLQDVFGCGEIEKIYLNFSDPWPKSRQEKRRLTSNTFLPIFQSILTESGDIEFKTDNQKLFEYSVLNMNKNHMEMLDFSLHLHQREETIITTEYEDRFSTLGQPIYYIKIKFRGEKNDKFRKNENI
jgi:tRNA (guanine-N7-)-methyltransferase